MSGMKRVCGAYSEKDLQLAVSGVRSGDLSFRESSTLYEKRKKEKDEERKKQKEEEAIQRQNKLESEKLQKFLLAEEKIN